MPILNADIKRAMFEHKYEIMEEYINEDYKLISDSFRFFSSTITYSIKRPLKATITTTVYYVFSVTQKEFFDSIDIYTFNRIISTIKIKLNNYDKATFYNLWVYQISPKVYEIKRYTKMNSIGFKKLYERSFPLSNFWYENNKIVFSKFVPPRWRTRVACAYVFVVRVCSCLFFLIL